MNDGTFQQVYAVPNARTFNDNEILSFQTIMEGYTLNISGAGAASRINSTCNVYAQEAIIEIPLRRYARRRLQEGTVTKNQVKFSMEWSSMHVNLSTYTTKFGQFINDNLMNLTADLQSGGLNVSESFTLTRIQVNRAPSSSPTSSIVPSSSPSLMPTMQLPSLVPSPSPSEFPSSDPTSSPSLAPSTTSPSIAPTNGIVVPGGINTTVLVVILVALFIIVALVVALIFRHRKRVREQDFQAAMAAGQPAESHNNSEGLSERFKRLSIKTGAAALFSGSDAAPRSDDNHGLISPNESLLSNQSLLSEGMNHGAESVDEADRTHQIADEFDQYKDQNLEMVRNGVEDNVKNTDGMMSQAMTLALMGDDDPVADSSDLFWGGTGDATEIEASALCEVNDFLKRKDGAGVEER